MHVVTAGNHTTDLIIGLDISTTTTGITVLGHDGSLEDLMYVSTADCASLWDVADKIRHTISALNVGRKYTHVFVEEDLKRFKRGRSSAHTLMTLAKINGIVSYMVRTAFSVEPIAISVNDARKRCGIKLVKAKTADEKKDALWTKRQVFDHMTSTRSELSCITWPMTKPSAVNPTGRIRTECYDMIDSYVIARAGLLDHV